MQKILRLVLFVLVAAALSVLTTYLLAPFLPVMITRSLSIGLVFGTITVLEEIYVKKSAHPFRQGLIAVVATMGILLALDFFW